jgi:hypothetical protein
MIGAAVLVCGVGPFFGQSCMIGFIIVLPIGYFDFISRKHATLLIGTVDLDD